MDPIKKQIRQERATAKAKKRYQEDPIYKEHVLARSKLNYLRSVEQSLANNALAARRYRKRQKDLRSKDPLLQGQYRSWLNKRYATVRQRNMRHVQDFKSQGCLVCRNEFEPCALEAHHVDPTTKKFSVSAVACSTRSEEAVLQELALCVCVCCNCHRKIHAKAIQVASSIYIESIS